MTGLRARLEELRLAFVFLTRLPVGRLPDPAPSLAAARWAFPLVGLVTGLIGWGVFAGTEAAGLSPRIAAILSIVATVLATGALHLDGLADVADGFWGGHDRARRLEIMRDSRIGSYGVIALILVLALKAEGIAAAGGPLWAYLAIGVGSRTGMVLPMLWLPPAREDGLGHSATLKAEGDRAAAIAAVVALTAVLVASVTAGAAILAAVLVTGLIARGKIGGQTGDVLGAAQAVASAAAWVVLAA